MLNQGCCYICSMSGVKPVKRYSTNRVTNLSEFLCAQLSLIVATTRDKVDSCDSISFKVKSNVIGTRGLVLADLPNMAAPGRATTYSYTSIRH